MKTIFLAALASLALTFTLAGTAQAAGETAAPTTATAPADTGRTELDTRTAAGEATQVINNAAERQSLDERIQTGNTAALQAAGKEAAANAAERARLDAQK